MQSAMSCPAMRTYCLTAGLLGLKNAMLTATKGTAVLNTHFADYAPWLGDISVRELGSLTAYETGQVTTYALQSIEARGRLFVSPGQDIYAGQVGITARLSSSPCNPTLTPIHMLGVHS